jgi:hypothetical protein
VVVASADGSNQLVSRRLVEEDDRRIPNEAHRDVEAAAHATRIRRHFPRGCVGQREAPQQIIRDLPRVLEVPQPGDHHEVLPPGQDLVDGRELPGEADGLSHVSRLRSDIEAVDAGSARVGLEQCGQDVDDRGLAGAVGAEECEDAPARHVEVHTREHLQVLVGLPQSVDLDCLAVREAAGHVVSVSFPLSAATSRTASATARKSFFRIAP